MKCEELRELAPEIALGTVEGEERADALAHLATCAGCRRFVDQLAAAADELLLLAPEQEPPPGFEARVLAALRPRRRSRRLLARLAPPLAAAAATAIALVAVYHGDHVTAERYRETLAQANGRAFQAAPLRDGAGRRVGVVFGYQGTPSWVFVTVDRPVRRAELVTTRRTTIPLAVELRRGSWGGAIPMNLYRVAALRLLGARPGDVYTAALR